MPLVHAPQCARAAWCTRLVDILFTSINKKKKKKEGRVGRVSESENVEPSKSETMEGGIREVGAIVMPDVQEPHCQ